MSPLAKPTSPRLQQALLLLREAISQSKLPYPIINFDEISVAIGLQSCPDGSCNPTNEYLGTILYQGPYTPQPSGVGTNLFQNFTVTIPSSTPSGQAILGVANFYLDGTGYTPNLNVVNETLTIA
ncbi:hypothetical protein PAXRUDRAFT_205440 [Paxillus rubicundulus Ve08.2h10]|uniref:Uncharacterized protein n=1 Tax=Paxillus rubicundulus Ve08.2h10 TaxID=930991 RepID=A0A0D0DHT1_9AGAM|nr:hypothetical protein PAXRUDRAFT_205440 [Paxillus rubicundulus Ve08.2h10]